MESPPHLRSRRNLNLRFDIPIARTREFWEKLGEGRFVSTKCARCGNVTFPPQADCPRCMSGEFEWVDLGTTAELVTFTRVRVAPASFSGAEGYTIAIGRLPGGVKVLAWLQGGGEPRPGMKLRIESRIEGGNPYYVFVPA